jgi:hypothetical protein
MRVSGAVSTYASVTSTNADGLITPNPAYISPSTVTRLRSVGADYADDDLVFAHEDISHLHATTASRTFCARANQAGLREIRLHDLRHTQAVRPRSRGASEDHPRAPRPRKHQLTLDTYSHVTLGMQE